jgi:hypothetical protein
MRKNLQASVRKNSAFEARLFAESAGQSHSNGDESMELMEA